MLRRKMAQKKAEADAAAAEAQAAAALSSYQKDYTGQPGDTVKSSNTMLMQVGGALAASTLAGMALTSQPLEVLATTMNGSLGATIGVLLGGYFVNPIADTTGDYTMYYPLLGAIVIPGLVGGKWDVITVGLGVGAYAGYYLANSYNTSQN